MENPERPRPGSGWSRGFRSGPSTGSRRKGGRSLLSASAGGSHTKVLDGLRTAPSPRTLPRDQPSWDLPSFQREQTSGGCAASPGCWSSDAPRNPRASGAPGRISYTGKGHHCPLARTSPGHGIFGKRLPTSPLPGPPMVISRGGSSPGCGSHVSLPALGWGNTALGEITGNHKAKGWGRINPG